MKTLLVNGKRGLSCLLPALIWACGNGGDMPANDEGGPSDPGVEDVQEALDEAVGDLDAAQPTDEDPGGVQDLSEMIQDTVEMDVPVVPELHPQCFANSHCDDEDPCTLDHCDEDRQCVHDPVDCNDGDPCTLGTCVAEQGCVYEPIPDCVPSNCETDQDCVDQNPCTLDEKCVGGGCSYTVMDCDDGKECTLDSCNPATGTCKHDAATGCDDGDPCTWDWCHAPQNYKCVHTPLTCDDEDPCTTDSCDPDVGCLHGLVDGCTPGCGQDSDCDDDDPCTTDACHQGVCNSWWSGDCCWLNSDCDDGDPCTWDQCDPPGKPPKDSSCQHFLLPGCA